MLRSRKEKQQGMEVVILEQMYHDRIILLRKIDRSIDFSFINKLCAPLYSENVGRPAVDPEILFRMLFVGYLYRHPLGKATGGRNQLQLCLQMVLWSGADRESTGCYNDQRQSDTAVPG